MSLLNKLFGKDKQDKEIEKKFDNSTHEEEWEFYFSKVDDIIGSFYVDLGLLEIAPIKDKPNLVTVSLKMNHPDEDGLSTEEEFDKLIEIEERLQEFIEEKHNSIYVGRLTSNKCRDYYFYFGDTTLYDKTISEALVAFPSYSYEFEIIEDKEWETYLEFLYPTPIQFQIIQNRKVIDQLEENGDTLTKERQVDHWIYFQKKEDRERFLTKIKDNGFQIINQGVGKKSSGLPYSLQIARVDKVDIDSANEYILFLWELAGECNGNYDGWETFVESE
jgi:uncharacterized protein (TIGR01619 family)